MPSLKLLSLPALCWTLLCALACSPGGADEAAQNAPKPLAPAQLYKQCLPSVVTLKVKYADDTDGYGTGFLALKEGCALTAWHVVRNARSVTAKFADGEEFEVSGVVDRDEKRDLALIRVKVAGRPQLNLTPDDPEVGARTFVIGAPRGLEFSLSDGLLSGIRKDEGLRLFQFSSPISPGNSGGPLLLEDGRVAGVVRSLIKEGQNLNFAVPAVYALGLDSSLPTKPWDELVVPDDAPLTAKETRESLHVAFIVMLDASEVLSRTYVEVAQVEGGYEDGVPGYLDRHRYDLVIALEALKKLRDQEMMSPLITALEKPLQQYAKSVGLYIEAIEAAVEDEGWSEKALELHKNALAAWKEADTAERSFYTSWEELEIPADIEELFYLTLGTVLNGAADEESWELGIRTLASEPMVVFQILPDAWARHLDLKVGDHILSVDGEAVSSIIELKTELEQKVGKYVLLTLKRNGKEESLARKVPPIIKAPKK